MSSISKGGWLNQVCILRNHFGCRLLWRERKNGCKKASWAADTIGNPTIKRWWWPDHSSGGRAGKKGVHFRDAWGVELWGLNVWVWEWGRGSYMGVSHSLTWKAGKKPEYRGEIQGQSCFTWHSPPRHTHVEMFGSCVCWPETSGEKSPPEM